MLLREAIMTTEPTTCPAGRKLLIAVDGSENSNRAIEYVACMLGDLKRVSIGLLHIISIPPDDYFYSAQEQTTWIEERENAALSAVEKHCRSLIDAGIPETAVHYTIRKGTVVHAQ